MKTIRYHIDGIKLTAQALSKGKFLEYFIPGIVLTLFFLYYQYFLASNDGFLGLTTGISWLDWIADLFESLLSFIVKHIYLFIVLTALSPFFTMLGEKFDFSLSGNKFNSTFKKFISDILRMVLIVFIMIILEYVFILFYWVFAWSLDFHYIDDVVYFIISSFFFGFAFFDFALERYKKGVGSSLMYAFSNPLTMILTGGIFLGIYNIPIVGVPLSPVLTVMISTVVYLYQTERLPIKQEFQNNATQKLENE